MLPEALAPASTRADAERVARLALEEDGPRDLTTGVTGAGEEPTVEGSSTGAAGSSPGSTGPTRWPASWAAASAGCVAGR